MKFKNKYFVAAVAMLSQIAYVMAGTLPFRPNTTTTLTPVPTSRLQIITDLWGGYNTTTESPNWGMLIYNAGMVYQDAIGQIAWVILFALPFLMMWIVQADMTLPSLVGMLFSLYVFLKLPTQYIMLSVGMFAISIAALIWSLYRRAY